MTIRFDRLEQLAAFLDDLPPERFYYGSWVGGTWQGDPELSCGTTACALGWATTLWPDELRLAPGGTVEGRQGRFGFCAAEDFFGICFTDAGRLFYPPCSGLGAYATPKEVAAHIRKFIAEKTESA